MIKTMELKAQQKEALKCLTDFMEDKNSNVFILKGYAGTGKTTLIKVFYETIEIFGYCPQLMAPTGRAAKVLSEKTGIEATTIHKAIYHRTKFEVVRHDEDGNPIQNSTESKPNAEIDDMNIYFGIKEITDEREAQKTVIIIDESSLISSKQSSQELIHFGTDILLADLLTYAQLMLGTKVVFVGDPAQLPPVGDNQSCALSEDYFMALGINVKSFTLTDVVRQQTESMILTNAMKVRSLIGSPLRNELCFDTKDNEVEAIAATDVVSRYTSMYPAPQLGQSVVICFCNTQAQSYNEAIRKHYYESNELQHGDVLQVVKNNYNVCTVEGALLNGDFIRVTSSPTSIEGRTVPVWVSRNGNRERVHIMLQFQEITFETDRGSTGMAKILINLLANNRPSLTREESVALYIDFVMRHPTLRKHDKEFVQAMMSDPYYNALQAKYGYAITGHKSQGGEWDAVFVDYTGRTGLDNDSLRWNYTATTRAAKCLYGVNIPNITPFNKFSIAPIQSIAKVQGDVVHIKDVNCPSLPENATPAQKAKYISAAAALEEIGAKIISVTCKPYRDRYSILTTDGQKDFDCIYNAIGLYTTFTPVHPGDNDATILRALRDDRYYEYDTHYSPTMPCLEQLQRAIMSAADELGITITGAKEYSNQYYVLYGLKTSAPFASLQFYYNGKGFITRALASSMIGSQDELLHKICNRITELTCQQ